MSSNTNRYRAAAGDHEKWAVDKMYEAREQLNAGNSDVPDTHQLKHQLHQREAGILRENGLVIGSEQKIDECALKRLAENPTTAQNLVKRMIDYEFAAAAVDAVATTGERYWESKVFQHQTDGLNDRSSDTSKAVLVARLVQGKREELGLDKPGDRFSVKFR